MPTPNWAIFGPVKTTRHVENAVVALAEEWLPTYVNVVANSLGIAPGTIKYPQSVQRSYDFDNYRTQPLPAFVVVCSTTESLERSSPKGEVGAWFDFEAGVLVDDQNETSARDVASIHASAVALMLEQWGALGELQADNTLVTQLDVALPNKEVRSLALGRVKAHTFVNSIFEKYGLDSAARSTLVPQGEGPATPWPEWPTVETADLTVTAVSEIEE